MMPPIPNSENERKRLSDTRRLLKLMGFAENMPKASFLCAPVVRVLGLDGFDQ